MADGQLDSSAQLQFTSRYDQRVEGKKQLTHTFRNAGVPSSYRLKPNRDTKMEDWFVKEDGSLQAVEDDMYSFMELRLSALRSTILRKLDYL